MAPPVSDGQLNAALSTLGLVDVDTASRALSNALSAPQVRAARFRPVTVQDGSDSPDTATFTDAATFRNIVLQND